MNPIISCHMGCYMINIRLEKYCWKYNILAMCYLLYPKLWGVNNSVIGPQMTIQHVQCSKPYIMRPRKGRMQQPCVINTQVPFLASSHYLDFGEPPEVSISPVSLCTFIFSASCETERSNVIFVRSKFSR